jgi:hypothetical protein
MILETFSLKNALILTPMRHELAGPGGPTLFLKMGLERRPTWRTKTLRRRRGFDFNQLRAGFRFAAFSRIGWLRPAF